MKKFTLKVAVIAILGLGFTSCVDNDNGVEPTPAPAPNPNPEPTPEPEPTAPTVYSFDRNGETSVSYGGQTARLNMGTEFLAALKDNTKTEAQLEGMFMHEAGSNDFADADLNASSKNIGGKTENSDYFLGLISAQVSEVFTTWDSAASAGVAGKVTYGDKTRYVNAKGLEYDQAINKGLMGAFVGNQVMNGYLSDAKLDGTNNEYRTKNDAGTIEDGKNYTKMEHHWDEAFGYIYGLEADAAAPELGKDKFLNKYMGKLKGDYPNVINGIYNAFVKGRYAITVKDYATRDEQVAIISENLSKVIAIKATDYLGKGKEKIEAGTDRAEIFHDLSEGYGFVYSLQFTRNPQTNAPYFTAEEVDAMIAQLDAGNGLWEVSADTLNVMIDTIANKLGL